MGFKFDVSIIGSIIFSIFLMLVTFILIEVYSLFHTPDGLDQNQSILGNETTQRSDPAPDAVKNYTCFDGEKQYSIGLFVKIDGMYYHCKVKGNHAEWSVVKGFQ